MENREKLYDKALEIMKRVYHYDRAGQIHPKDIQVVFDCIENGKIYQAMWEKTEKIAYAYFEVCDPPNIATCLADYMKMLMESCFPVRKDKRVRLNDIITRLTNYNGLGNMSDIIGKLIKIRDEDL